MINEYKVVYPLLRRPSHPGAILADLMLDIGKSELELAEEIGVTEAYLHAIIGERQRVLPYAAAQLAEKVGGSPDLWLNLQRVHDDGRSESGGADH